MTAVVGLVHNGTVHLGGDSAAPQGWDLIVRADPKVFTVGPYAIGFTTSWRMGQVLRWSFKPPKPDVTHLDRFMAAGRAGRHRARIPGCHVRGGRAVSTPAGQPPRPLPRPWRRHD
jgi:hypothetical protein